MSIVRLDLFKQSKQRQYMTRYRDRLDHFIKARVPLDSSSQMIRMAESAQLNGQFNNQTSTFSPNGSQEIVWDYFEMRELMLDFVAKYIAEEIFEELKSQFWFDESFISKDMVTERCLSHMILGTTAIAADI